MRCFPAPVMTDGQYIPGWRELVQPLRSNNQSLLRQTRRCRLVPKSMTLDDLERPFRTLYQNVCVFGAHYENFNEDTSYYQRQKCSAMTVVSDNIMFMRIFAGVPWRRGVKRQWGNRKRRFSGFRMLRLRQLRK